MSGRIGDARRDRRPAAGRKRRRCRTRRAPQARARASARRARTPGGRRRMRSRAPWSLSVRRVMRRAHAVDSTEKRRADARAIPERCARAFILQCIKACATMDRFARFLAPCPPRPKAAPASRQPRPAKSPRVARSRSRPRRRTRLPLRCEVPRMEMKPACRRDRDSTTRATSTTRAAWASSRTSRAASPTTSSRRASRSSTTCATAAPRAPIRCTATARGCWCRSPTPSSARRWRKQGVKLPKAGAYGVGMVFLPRNPAARAACVREIERAIANEGQQLLGWRDVPVDDSTLGPTARGTHAGDPPGVRRRGPRQPRPRRLRAQALHHPQEPAATPSARSASRTRAISTCRRSRTAPSSTRACCSPSRWAPFYRDLHRQALRLGAVPRAPALLHQHLPDVGPRAPVPLHRAQRRDQHAAAATSTGSSRARRRSTRSCWARTSTRSGRSSTTASRTRPRSTTRSSCW